MCESLFPFKLEENEDLPECFSCSSDSLSMIFAGTDTKKKILFKFLYVLSDSEANTTAMFVPLYATESWNSNASTPTKSQIHKTGYELNN